ncbi:MAG: DMT family transporter [Notoacmeibacter sp.]|nr:DMT family transporter [Notoacmeibacter sp.]
MLFSCLDASAKYLVTSGMQAPFVSWFRFAEHVVLALVFLRVWKRPQVFHVNNLPAQALRGLFLFGSTIFNFMALRSLQLAETISIFFFAPMVITALAGPFLGEWAGWRRWMAILVGFIGVLVITRPGAGAIGIGHVYIVAAMLSYCFYVLMTRKMSATESAESLIFYSALTPAIVMSPALPLYGSLPPSAWHWVALLGLGFFGGFGHWLLINAYKRASTSALAPYPYMQMVWMVLLGYFAFGQLPDVWTIAGALIIAGSGLYIVHREHRLRIAARSVPGSTGATLAKKL